MIILLYIARLTTFIQIHISAPIATKLGTEVLQRVKGCRMKELFQRVHCFKGQSEQKQMPHAGIEHANLACFSERSNLRASMHSTVSMAIWHSAATIEHHHRAAADSVDLQDFWLLIGTDVRKGGALGLKPPLWPEILRENRH